MCAQAVTRNPAFYESMINVKTKFGDEEAEKKARWLDDAMMEQERQLSLVVQQLFQSKDDGANLHEE